MDAYDEIGAVLAPLKSLLGKSEKAVANLHPGTWQESMTRANIHALHVVLSLMEHEDIPAYGYSTVELDETIVAIDSMIARTEDALVRFNSGKSQHTLLTNRLRALTAARDLIEERH